MKKDNASKAAQSLIDEYAQSYYFMLANDGTSPPMSMFFTHYEEDDDYKALTGEEKRYVGVEVRKLLRDYHIRIEMGDEDY